MPRDLFVLGKQACLRRAVQVLVYSSDGDCDSLPFNSRTLVISLSAKTVRRQIYGEEGSEDVSQL